MRFVFTSFDFNATAIEPIEPIAFELFNPFIYALHLLYRAHRLLKGLPNTYAYTKALTEDLVNSYAGRLPIVITRPSIGTYVLAATLTYTHEIQANLSLFVIVAFLIFV